MKKTSLIIILLAVPALLAACSSTTETPIPAAGTTAPASLVIEGRLLPLNSMDQAFTVPGRVAEVLVQDGEIVTAGQVLARLEVPADLALVKARAEQEMLAAEQALADLEANAGGSLAQARLEMVDARDALDKAQSRYDTDDSDLNQAQLQAAQARLKLAEDTFETLDGSAGQDPQAAAAGQARLETAKASVKAAEAALASLELKATIDGTVTGLDLQPGQIVASGASVMTLADLSAWVVETDSLTELDVPGISVGQEAQISFDALPDLTLAGVVTHINSRYEEKRGDVTYTTTLRIAQPDPRLRWGMTAAVEFAR